MEIQFNCLYIFFCIYFLPRQLPRLPQRKLRPWYIYIYTCTLTLLAWLVWTSMKSGGLYFFLIPNLSSLWFWQWQPYYWILVNFVVFLLMFRGSYYTSKVNEPLLKKNGAIKLDVASSSTMYLCYYTCIKIQVVIVW